MPQRFLFALLPFLLLQACRNDFTLEGGYRDIPVAYAFLNAEDDRHFVRVQKAFLEAGGDATATAGIADSLYYGDNEATVLLTNLTTLETVALNRVDGAQFGLNRDDGIFATTPNVVYTVTDERLRLRAGQEVRLDIERPGETTASATTTLLAPLDINRPRTMVGVDEYRRPLIISWSNEDNARVYDVRIFFHIRELFPADPNRNREVTLTWPLATGFTPANDQVSTSLIRFEADPESFYRFLGGALEPNDAVIRRFLDFDLQVTAAGQEVLDRSNIENANAGITSSQSLPRYSNLVGGIGLITSTSTGLVTGIQFDQASLDSLESGQYTRDLNFR